MAKKKKAKTRARLDDTPAESLYLQPRAQGGGVRLAAPQAAPAAPAVAPSFRGLEAFASAPSRRQKKVETAGAKWGHMAAPTVGSPLEHVSEPAPEPRAFVY